MFAEREGFALGPKGRFHQAERLKERENPVRIRKKKRAAHEVALVCGERGIRARPEGTLSPSGATERT